MRESLVFVALLPVLIAIDVALWILAPGRRLVRSVVVAGIVVGRCAARAAW